jgi:hypothetical protein
MNGDGGPDIVMMGDERTKLNALCWFFIPTTRNSRGHATIGPPVHGATYSGGRGTDRDGDLTWSRRHLV